MKELLLQLLKDKPLYLDYDGFVQECYVCDVEHVGTDETGNEHFTIYDEEDEPLYHAIKKVHYELYCKCVEDSPTDFCTLNINDFNKKWFLSKEDLLEARRK